MLLKRILFIVIAFLIPSSTFCQGSLLKRGASGIGFQAGLAGSSEVNTLSGAAILTFGGIVDIGGGVVSASHKGKIRSVNQTYFVFITELYVFREDNPRIPFTLSLFGDYSMMDETKFGTFGITFYKRGVISKTSFIQPFVTIFKTWSSDVHAPGGFGFGFSIASTKNHSRIFHLTPSFAIAEGSNAFALSIGYTFGPTGYNRNGPPYFDF